MDTQRRQALEAKTRYEPGQVEPAVLVRWLESGAFEAHADAPGEAYTIAIPPPNVTGALHMGHALNGSIQDVLIRVRRMQGRNALWVFGMDHAGIAVQNVVEKLLAQDGKTRHDLGRERFVEKVWEWKAEYGGIIRDQLKRLGASLDYRRERFTMDDEYARAVLQAFVRLYRKGYLFRDNRMVSWCPRCHTAISDLEVEHREVQDTLYSIDYPVEGGGHVTVATVRPATMLGDTGVAVNPDDERYRELVGKTAIVPLAERSVPIVADDYVDVSFGTGALKITPGHDPNDFEIGRRHGLPEIAVIGFDGNMTEEAGQRYAGLPVADAEKRVVEDLRERGLLRAEQPYTHSVGHCERCGTRIEPLVSLQWFCRMEELAAPAIADVREGSVRFHPKGAERIFFHWMDAIRPWCVSRQLWWGHQLPVWYCSCGDTIVEEQEPTSCPSCGGSELERDPDVLDTWFSSALWPFATLGWPEDTDDLRTFHPTQVNSTAREIINLWCARMMMMSREFLGVVPFSDIIIHSTVLAADGRRMSKSLGTGVDPLQLIDRYGADATRYGLLKMSSTQDVRFAEGMLDEGLRLCNKLYNASRLILLGAADVEPEPLVSEPVDAWMLARLDRATAELTEHIDAYDFSTAVKTLYRYVWNEVCDWYLEACKARLQSDDEAVREAVSKTLLYVLDRTLRLAHPVLPHITEELWTLSGRDDLLMLQAWPKPGEAPRDDDAETAVGNAFELVGQLRQLRGEIELPPRANLAVTPDDPARAAPLQGLIEGLAHVSFAGSNGAHGIPLSAGDLTLRVVDEQVSTQFQKRLAGRLEAARGELRRAEGKLANERFVTKAKPELVEAEREKVERFSREVADYERRIADLA